MIEKGPRFLQFFNPIIHTLKEFNGSAKSKLVVEKVLKDFSIDKDNERQKREIAWARLYLVKSSYLKSDSPRGIWTLSEKGSRANDLTNEELINYLKKFTLPI